MNVLVLAVRGFHLGYLGCYGNPWLATPHLDRLATQGIVFDQHIADAPSPAGARRSWRTGRYHLPLPGQADAAAPFDLLDLCRQHEIATTLVTDEPQADFAAGWRQVVKLPRSLKKLPATPLVWVETSCLLPPWNPPAGLLAEHFQPPDLPEEEQILTELNEEEVEEPLEPLLDPAIGLIDPDDDRTFLRLQQTYAVAVAAFDAALGQLLNSLAPDTLFILTSDHGLPLGEHAAVGLCRPWLHEELIHIPLIIRLPGNAEAGRRVAAFTQSIDLMPTLLDLLGLPIPDGLHGQTLTPLWGSQPLAASRPFAVSGTLLDNCIEYALRTPDWSFLLPANDPTRRRQLYVKPDDRWEVNDVVQHHLERADELEQTLLSFVKSSL